MILLILACGPAPETDVYVERRVFNEIMCHAAVDWVELFATEPLDLSGWTLVDDLRADATPWAFPEGTTMAAGEFLVVYLDAGVSTADALHASFRLDSFGGDLLLFDGDTLVDEGRFPLMLQDVSWARVPDAGPYWQQVLVATPGATNGEVR